MNILILTQSGPTGLNQQVALACKHIAEEVKSTGIVEIKIDNASSIAPSSVDRYSHVIMIAPEWNGSFPHTFKSLIDGSGYPSAFKKKKVLLVGTSSSDFGNIMGITHLQHILQWVGAFVDSKRICIPRIQESVDPIDGFRDVEDRLYKAIKKFLQ
jgi:NAD(P)H-dependent FMN reductase